MSFCSTSAGSCRNGEYRKGLQIRTELMGRYMVLRCVGGVFFVSVGLRFVVVVD